MSREASADSDLLTGLRAGETFLFKWTNNNMEMSVSLFTCLLRKQESDSGCLETAALTQVLLSSSRYFALSSQRLESLRTSSQGSSPTSPPSTASTTSSCSPSWRRGLQESGKDQASPSVWCYSTDGFGSVSGQLGPLLLAESLRQLGGSGGGGGGICCQVVCLVCVTFSVSLSH